MKILQFLKESNGQYSSVRLAFVLWVFVPLIVWIAISVTTWNFAPIPWEYVALCNGLLTGKAIQKPFEMPHEQLEETT